MAKRIPVALAVYAVLVAMVLAGTASPIEARSGGSAAYVPDQIIVRFADDLDAQGQAQVNARNGGQEVDQLGGIGTKVVRVAAGSVEHALRAYRAESRVRYAEPNYILHAISPIRRPLATIPNDPSFGQLWGLRNTGQTLGCGGSCYGAATGTAGADIKAEPAWTITTGSNTIVVGVVDTGIDYNHPDLAANVWSNPGDIGGCPAGTHGFRATGFFTTSCDPLDDNDHGTHVSGTIGASGNNGVGVVGVNWNVKIMGLKFLSASGSGSTSNAIKVIDFAVNAKMNGVNVRVLSNSWGGGGFSQALLDAINRANANDILFVAAAGNSATDNDITPSYPASYNAPNVLAVAATTNTDGLASFSSYGLTSVDLGAPGQDILSTTRNNTYAYFTGTSMATPHVSGAAALVLARTPAMNVETLKSTLMSSVDAIGSLTGKTVTGGRLNLCKAVGGCGGPPPAADYSLSVIPASVTVTQGGSTTYTVTVTPSSEFTGTVTFGASGLPAGASASFDPASVATSGISTMNVATSATTPIGTFPLTITGADGTLSRTATATLVVQAPATPNFTISATPTSRTINRGFSTTYTVNIARSGGFTEGVTFDVSGLRTGQTGTFSPDLIADSWTLTIETTATAVTGSRVLTITGTGGSLSRTTTVTLVVKRGKN